MDDPAASRLRTPLSSRQRQDLINRLERRWLNDLHALGIDVGHHPFLSAGDSEVVEARFFEALRAGVSLEKNLTGVEFSSLCNLLDAASTTNRAVVVFSPNAAVLGAFATDSAKVFPQLESIATKAGFELAIMAVDAGHGLSIERSMYNESGERVPGGALLIRAWGDFATAISERL